MGAGLTSIGGGEGDGAGPDVTGDGCSGGEPEGEGSGRGEGVGGGGVGGGGEPAGRAGEAAVPAQNAAYVRWELVVRVAIDTVTAVASSAVRAVPSASNATGGGPGGGFATVQS